MLRLLLHLSQIARFDDKYRIKSARTSTAPVHGDDDVKSTSKKAPKRARPATKKGRATGTPAAASAGVEQYSSLEDMKNRWAIRYDTSDAKAMRYLQRILLFDQLSKQRGIGAAFEGFEEGKIQFPPSFKYDKRSAEFDSSEKARCPAWTDRILFADQRRQTDVKAAGATAPNSCMLQLRDYYCIDARDSDHRPVCADFTVRC